MKIRCNGRNKDGSRCKKRSLKNSRFCYIHREQAPTTDDSLDLAVIGGSIGVGIGGLPGALLGAGVGLLIGQSTRKETMSKTKVLISFDYDNDSDLKNFLVGQAKNEGAPFEIADWSVKEHLTGDWKEKVRSKMRRIDQVAVICGEQTHTAVGVAEEVKIAQEESVPYFLLKGRSTKVCTKPTSAKSTDKIYKWTWDNLKLLIGGKR